MELIVLFTFFCLCYAFCYSITKISINLLQLINCKRKNPSCDSSISQSIHLMIPLCFRFGLFFWPWAWPFIQILVVHLAQQHRLHHHHHHLHVSLEVTTIPAQQQLQPLRFRATISQLRLNWWSPMKVKNTITVKSRNAVEIKWIIISPNCLVWSQCATRCPGNWIS